MLSHYLFTLGLIGPLACINEIEKEVSFNHMFNTYKAVYNSANYGSKLNLRDLFNTENHTTLTHMYWFNQLNMKPFNLRNTHIIHNIIMESLETITILILFDWLTIYYAPIPEEFNIFTNNEHYKTYLYTMQQIHTEYHYLNINLSFNIYLRLWLKATVILM